MNKASVMYYVYDIDGNLLFNDIGMKSISEKLKIKQGALLSGIQRNSLLKGRYYISKDNFFDKKKYIKKTKVNPLYKFENKYLLNDYE
jgi:hypothetical protein